MIQIYSVWFRLVRVREICSHIRKKEEIDLDMCNATSMIDYIKPYTEPIIEYFRVASPDNLKTFKDSSKAGVTRSSLQMMYFINEQFSDFCPKELYCYLESIDKEGTMDARNKLDEIGGCLFEMTMTLLKEKHRDNWWYDGIPTKIQNECLLRYNEDRGIKAKEQYIFFIDYYSIAYHDWDLFQEYYSFSKDGGKEKQLRWVKDLNKIRQTTHHPEKWPALKEQVALVREYYIKVMGKYKMLKEKQDSRTLVAIHS